MTDSRRALAIGCGVVGGLAALAAVVTGEAAFAPVSGAAALTAAGLVLDGSRSRVVPPVVVVPPASVLAPDSVLDPDTGLLNEAYFAAAIESRVATARRVLRPLSIVMLAVVDDRHGGHAPIPVSEIADGLHRTLREADTACVLSGNHVGLLLEDTPEDGAVWTAERLRRVLVPEGNGRILWAGVASYPTHGLTAEDLHANVSDALRRASEWHQDRIEVA